MNKNLKWKFALILVLVILCIWEINPPSKKLKPGIDLAGGTSLLYQIDTSNLSSDEKRTAAQDMIRTLQERIDPGNQRNLVWRPHGNDRIEIQMPLASQEAQQLRDTYQKNLDQLKKYNLDLRAIRRVLVQPVGMSDADYLAARNQEFDRLAEGLENRQQLLKELASTYDAFIAGEKNRDQIKEKLQTLAGKLGEAKIETQRVELLAPQWNELDEPNRVERVKALTEEEPQQELIRQYITTDLELSAARSALAGAEGLKAKQEAAFYKVEQVNVDLDRLQGILEEGKTKRAADLASIKEKLPEEATQIIDDLIVAYDAYSKVSGRLDNPEDLKRQLRGSGVLDFRILPTLSDGILSESVIKTYRDRLSQFGPNPTKSGDANYAWRKIRDAEEFKSGNGITSEFAGKLYVLASNKPDETLLHETGGNAWELQSARPDTDQLGRWAISFKLNEIGANRFLQLTKSNLNRPLCILLDDEAISAPNIQSAIHQSGQITGQFSQQQVQDMVDKLRAGSLKARLSDRPISENTIGPLIGRDNLNAGLKAGVYGLIVVSAFMLVYYMLAGALANVALYMNLLIILASMAFSRATFTMPGIAGLILTIGMALDANVLVYERIREEQSRGSSIRMAIKNGYHRAFSAILDSNLTTVITALILWLVASEEVKGFALTLMIGLISNLFTALFVTRAIFDLMTDMKILKSKLSMLQMIQTTKINFVGAMPVLITISAVLVVGGLVVFLSRDEAKNSKYSIEFTGGTSIHVRLNEQGKDMDRAAVEEAVRQAGRQMNNKQIAEGTGVQQIGPADSLEYEIVTTATNRFTATLLFPTEEKKTIEEVRGLVLDAAKGVGDDRLIKSEITAGAQPNEFILTTTQTNRNKINEMVAALPRVQCTNEKTEESVNQAIIAALGNKLDSLYNLEPANVTAQPITPELVAQKPYLVDYQGGLLLSGEFGNNKTESLKRLTDRFGQLRFKSDFAKYGLFQYNLFAPSQAQVDTDAPQQGVEVALRSDDILYGGSEETEWNAFKTNMTEWFTRGLELETSLPRVTQIDPSVGEKSMQDALVAMVLAIVAIIIYVWVRFGNVRFGVAGIVAMVHDVSIALGMIAITPWLASTAVGKFLLISDFKIDLTIIAAILTLIGYSINDTIVVFDRIRENRGKLANVTGNIINLSINQTLSRTLLTGSTTLMVLIIMYIWGGAGLRGFNYVMIIGMIVGTYSSIAVAAPMLLLGLKNDSEKKAKQQNADKSYSRNPAE